MNSAGTDHPYYEDESTGQVWFANWNDNDSCYAFGYWPVLSDDGSGNVEWSRGDDVFSVGDNGKTHRNACEKVARPVLYDILCDRFEQMFDGMYGWLEDLLSEYDFDPATKTLSRGGETVPFGEYVEENCPWNDDPGLMTWLCLKAHSGDLPLKEEMADSRASQKVRLGVAPSFHEAGGDWDDYFADGRLMGRVWPTKGIITFYPTEQPEPDEFRDVLRSLEAAGLSLSVADMMGYVIIFEDPANDYQVTASTVSQYISGDYEDGVRFSRGGDAKFAPHLGSPEEKREFYRQFIDSRNKSKYAPRERVGGTLAGYHALRYPYGESVESRVGRVVSEVVRSFVVGAL